MPVSAIEKDKPDSTGAQICAVYAKRPPDYAVYRTLERLLVHYADNAEREQTQRASLVRLNPIRGEINGLVDGWRCSRNAQLRAKGQAFDRRVADSLVLGLEGDVDSAGKLLAAIKQEIIEERTSWARFQYLIAALVTVLLAVLLASCLGSDWFRWRFFDFPPSARQMLFAFVTGAVGAFFSIAIAIRSRTVLTDLRYRDNTLDAMLRIFIGAIAASLLACFVIAHAVELKIGSAAYSSEDPWLYILIVAFLGGFSERMVPDLLSKFADQAGAAGGKGSQTTTATEIATTNSAPAAAAAPQSQPVGPDPATADDHCLCDHPVADDQVTLDTELPAATGGVAAQR